MKLLEVHQVHAAYGRIRVLEDVSLHIDADEIVALIGANGAGKTTLLRTLSGVHPAQFGRILFAGSDVSARTPQARLRAGMAQVPEGRQVFGPLSVRDNLLMGAYVREQSGVAQDIESMFDLFPVLREKQHLPAGSLSGGQQQMLALGRALMARPRLLLLDEPSMGLAPVIVQEVFRIIQQLREQGTTILLVEQNAHLALTVADRAYVMESGRIAFGGDAATVRADPQVQKAYLGL